MRAVVVRRFGPIEDAGVEEVPDPVPGPGQVVVDVAAAGVNFPDLLVMRGLYQILPEPPFSPGKEVSGIVSALGTGVRTCRIGDRVIALVECGGYCERLLAPAANCFVIPAGMPLIEAGAFALTYQTAHFALIDRARLQAGETVLVTGAAGGVGLACVRLAKALGARVLAGVSTPDKAAVVRAAGADGVLDVTVDNLRDSLREQVRAVTDGRGAEVVLEIVGGDVFDAALRALAWRGRLVTLGFAGGTIPKLSVNAILLKNIEVSGLHWSDYRERHPEWMRRVQDELFALYDQGKLPVTLDRALPMERFAEALAMLRDRRVKGKVVLTTGTSS